MCITLAFCSLRTLDIGIADLSLSMCMEKEIKQLIFWLNWELSLWSLCEWGIGHLQAWYSFCLRTWLVLFTSDRPCLFFLFLLFTPQLQQATYLITGYSWSLVIMSGCVSFWHILQNCNWDGSTHPKLLKDYIQILQKCNWDRRTHPKLTAVIFIFILSYVSLLH